MSEQENNAMRYISKCARRRERKNRRRQRCIAKLLKLAPVIGGVLSVIGIALIVY